MWSFDGSSTEQAPGNSSDCLLKPVAIFPDPDRVNAYLVMTEVLNADGTPHATNGRSTIDEDDDDFFGAAEGDTTAEDVQVSFDEFGGEAPDGDGETPWEARERRKRRHPCRN